MRARSALHSFARAFAGLFAGLLDRLFAHTVTWRVPALLWVGLWVGLAGCTPAPLTPWTPPSTERLSADHTYLRDEAGRVAVLRGVNVRAGGIFDVRLDPVRCPAPTDVLEAIPEVTDADLDLMQALGFSVLRVPVQWSAIEPTEGSFDESYLDAVAELVGRAAARDIHSLIDVHQDGWSKDLGEDGAPLWATHGASGPIDEALLLCGPLGDTLQDRRISAPVGAAFTAFFGPESPSRPVLWAAFAEMVLHLAERFASEPYVLGLELFNEPVFDDRTLRSFHEEMAARIRAVHPNLLVFFEPSGLRNLTERGFVPPTPFAVDGAVYAPHLYTLAFSDPRSELDTVTAELLAPNFERMRSEAEAWHAPLFVGEWGIRPDSPGTARYIELTYDLFDRASASASVWVWKENSQGSWGFFDCAEDDETFSSCSPRAAALSAHARVYAERIAGEPLSPEGAMSEGAAHYDVAARTFTLRFLGRPDDAPHVLRVPADYPDAYAVRCDGTRVEPTPSRDTSGRIEVRCAGVGTHTLVLAPID